MSFDIGQRVKRIEDREIVGATVTAVEAGGYLIAYDEGGEGWWPAEALEADVTEPDPTEGG